MEDIYKIAEPFFNEQYKTVFVTTDGNVFYEKEFAEYHANRTDGKLYTVDAKSESEETNISKKTK